MKKVDVAIIGAGTAGLTARREVVKKTDSYVLIDDGPLGTTCARVGCMPSKVLIQVANDFDRRHQFEQQGIGGGENLAVDHKKVMTHVRSLRDRFVRGVLSGLEEWRDGHLIRGRAEFVDKNTLEVNGDKIEADKIIIATGSRPILPNSWEKYADYLIDTDQFFELEDLPKKVGVIGLGVIGIEIGQALARLGVDVTGLTIGKAIGGLTDKELQDYVFNKMNEEFPVFDTGADIVGEEGGQLIVKSGNKEFRFDKVFLTMGRRPNIDRLGYENTGLPTSEKGTPDYDKGTFKINNSDIYLVGDVNGERPILHEAADEGRIAGYNAVRDEVQCFRRRNKLGIVFSDPNIASIGATRAELENEKTEFVTGRVSFEGFGRAIVKLKEKGVLHLYAEKGSGKILGAELFAPDGEHLAHLISWAMSMDLTVFDVLSMPFYHPVMEEALRTALRDAASQVESTQPALEVLRCQDAPVK